MTDPPGVHPALTRLRSGAVSVGVRFICGLLFAEQPADNTILYVCQSALSWIVSMLASTRCCMPDLAEQIPLGRRYLGVASDSA
jgi:hypothetical protein